MSARSPGSEWCTPTRSMGHNYNRVAGADTRLVLGEIYSAQLQVAGSRTRVGGVTETGPLWSARLARNGRTFGARYTFTGVADDFRAQSGFIRGPASCTRIWITASRSTENRAAGRELYRRRGARRHLGIPEVS